MKRISFLNGKFLPHEKCLIHIEDRGFQFADGIYEVTYFKNSKLIDGVNHINRLFRNLKEINIDHQFSLEYLIDLQVQLFKKNKLTEGFCYLQITRGKTNRQTNIPKGLTPTISATVSPPKIFTLEQFTNGIKVITHDDIRWLRCDIKSVNLIAPSLVNQKAKDQDCDDAIFIRDKVITEATFANVFMVDENDCLITHPADNFILNGITRNRIIAIAKANNIKVEEKKFSLDQLLKAKEVFLTSTTFAVRPVSQINGEKLASFNIKNSPQQNFKIASLLSQKYQEFMI